MSTVIKVENLSKQYRLGQVGTGTISHDVNRWWHKIRGKEDPYLKIGESNDRTVKGDSDYVWALKDINFEVKQGEVLGIIGRNGAGKSTLLKILSRTTSPSTGSVKIKGRVASLLEVGTGFHPELSGRDNIFLNGAILGMTRREIQSKFDEIVDFAGVERYIDTPVKRYSSGMYVRLAFAVAAHLDPEILIVDEVLAVGDAEFQKKCLGKMKDVSVKQGRTVLFVSHNMQAVQKLCKNGIFMQNGIISNHEGINQIIDKYYLKGSNSKLNFEFDLNSQSEIQRKFGFPTIGRFENLSGEKLTKITVGEFWQFRIRFQIMFPMSHFIISIGIVSNNEMPIFTLWSEPTQIEIGCYEAVFVNNEILFSSGNFNLVVGLSNNEKSFFYEENATIFEILEIKNESIVNNNRVLRTSGAGVIINPLKVIIAKI